MTNTAAKPEPPDASPASPAGASQPSDQPPRIVALLPPLLQPSRVMLPLSWRLRRAGWDPRIFAYPTWRCDIPDNALRLAAWLRGLGQPEIDVVAFSLGSIVLRWAANHADIPRLRRVVLLGPPSKGAYMADLLSKKLGPLFPAVWGRSALQLRRGPLGLAARSEALPAGTEVGVVAGGTRKGKGFNPWIPGDNDLTVGVEETVVPGMTDFVLVHSTHAGLAFLGRPGRLVVRFLETGRFRTQHDTEHHHHPEPATPS